MMSKLASIGNKTKKVNLESFDETKAKCSKCQKYVEIKEAWKFFGAYVCLECVKKICKQDCHGKYIIPIDFSYVGNPCVPPESLKDKVYFDHGTGTQGVQDAKPKKIS